MNNLRRRSEGEKIIANSTYLYKDVLITSGIIDPSYTSTSTVTPTTSPYAFLHRDMTVSYKRRSRQLWSDGSITYSGWTTYSKTVHNVGFAYLRGSSTYPTTFKINASLNTVETGLRIGYYLSGTIISNNYNSEAWDKTYNNIPLRMSFTNENNNTSTGTINYYNLQAIHESDTTKCLWILTKVS